MEFIVSDRQSIERGLAIRKPHIIISIRDPSRDRAAIPVHPLCRGTLELAFDDSTPEDQVLAFPGTPMTPEQARQIREFVRAHQPIEAVVVHCEAGMSRSPAVAAALCRSMGGDAGIFFEQYFPNEHVFRLVCEACSAAIA